MPRHPIFRRNAGRGDANRQNGLTLSSAKDPGIGRGSSLLLIGMDNLSALENLFGEALGDEVGAEVEQRLAVQLPPKARLWRAEHRRYAVAVPGLGHEGPSALFLRLQSAIAQQAIQTSHGPVAVTLAAGCVIGGTAGDHAALADARHALCDAMAHGVGCIRFSGEAGATAQRRRETIDAAQIAMGALGRGDLTIAYQPVVAASSTGRASFHECLVRVRSPDGELLAAAKFMPAMEQLGLATLVDRQVLVMALESLARNPGIRLSVNIFPQTMQDAQWMMLFAEGTRHDDTLAERLIIEVTETAAMLDPARTQDFMDRLRRSGSAFALDDFGMGHTSFGSLRDFRFDMIKIDGSFITDITANPDSRFFVQKLVEIGHQFDMMTVAEFVTGAAEARILRDLGVDYFQGFYFGSPCLLLDPVHEPQPALIGVR
jgi:EAL domain-containing protein (putative c-di-GMP-specific phosphodiesterase class I)/GGDEF domain-containing protein